MANEFAALKPVDSSMFSRAGYDEETWALLFEFRSTKEIRAYKNVSPEVADAALAAESLGKFFNSQIKGNPGWEFETLGADPAQQPEPPKKPEIEGGITDADIQACDPSWKGEDEAVAEEENRGLEYNFPTGRLDNIAETYGGIKREPFGSETALTTQPVGEIMAAWTAPESAAEALDLMAEREGEINAIIAQNKETGEKALTVRVDSAEKRLAASETLNRLVSKADLTKAALDPFRKVLHEAYTEAQGKVKAGVDPLDAGIRHVKAQILAWDREQERLRQQEIFEARKAADAEARRLQEEESARLTLAEVSDKLEEGDVAGAEALIAAPIEAPRQYVQPQYIAPAAPKVEGQSTSTVWKVDREAVESDETGAAYISSITKLLIAVKNGHYAIEQAAPLLSWDFSAADKLAGALMSAFNVPGLTASPKSTLRVGRGRPRKNQ